MFQDGGNYEGGRYSQLYLVYFINLVSKLLVRFSFRGKFVSGQYNFSQFCSNSYHILSQTDSNLQFTSSNSTSHCYFAIATNLKSYKNIHGHDLKKTLDRSVFLKFFSISYSHSFLTKWKQIEIQVQNHSLLFPLYLKYRYLLTV